MGINATHSMDYPVWHFSAICSVALKKENNAIDRENRGDSACVNDENVFEILYENQPKVDFSRFLRRMHIRSLYPLSTIRKYSDYGV